MLRPADSPPGLTTLVLLSAISVLTLNMYIPSLGSLASDMNVTYGTASLSLSVYMVLTAVLQLIMGPLSDRFGRRPVLLWSMALFTLASVGCAVADSFLTFMVFRLLQGAVTAASTISRAIVRDTSEPQDAAARLGTIGVAMALAPMIAPMIGGGLETLFGWRSNFWTFTLFGMGLLWLCWSDVGETNREPSATFAEQFRKYPLIARDLGFWSYTLSMALALGVFFVYITGVPIVATQAFGLGAAMVGLVMGIPSMGFMFGNWITSRIGRRVALSTMMLAGRVISLAGLTIGFIVWSLGITHPIAFFSWMIFIGIGNGLTLPAGSAGAMSVRPDLAGTASGFSGALGILVGAIGTAVAGASMTVSDAPETLYVLLIAFALAGLIAALPARKTEKRLVAGT